MGNKNRQIGLGLPRNANEVPDFTDSFLISEIADQEFEFPFIGISLANSVVWYWAIQRYKIRGIDFLISKKYIKRAIMLLNRHVIPKIGKEWKYLEKYVNWYLQQNSSFIRSSSVQYNLEYLISESSIKPFLPKLEAMKKIDKVTLGGRQGYNVGT